MLTGPSTTNKALAIDVGGVPLRLALEMDDDCLSICSRTIVLTSCRKSKAEDTLVGVFMGDVTCSA